VKLEAGDITLYMRTPQAKAPAFIDVIPRDNYTQRLVFSKKEFKDKYAKFRKGVFYLVGKSIFFKLQEAVEKIDAQSDEAIDKGFMQGIYVMVPNAETTAKGRISALAEFGSGEDIVLWTRPESNSALRYFETKYSQAGRLDEASVISEGKGLNYDEFVKAYKDAFKQANKYTPDQIGSVEWTNKMADLADKYPEFLERLEKETDKEPWEMTKEEFYENSKAKLPDSHWGTYPEMKTKRESEFIVNATIAHRQHIEKAIKEGKVIPEKVLAEYPDLGTGLNAGASSIDKTKRTNIDIKTHASLVEFLKSQGMPILLTPEIVLFDYIDKIFNRSNLPPASMAFPKDKAGAIYKMLQMSTYLEAKKAEPWQMIPEAYATYRFIDSARAEAQMISDALMVPEGEGKAEHIASIKNALIEGKPVPEEVMKYYPNLVESDKGLQHQITGQRPAVPDEYFTKENAPDNIKDRFGISKTQDYKIISAVPKEFEIELPGGMKVYLVDGKYVRDNIYSDFAQGGNDMAYPEFVPIGHLWIEKGMDAEKAHILKHERDERDLMIKGMSYEDAHEKVKAVEDQERGVGTTIKKEPILGREGYFSSSRIASVTGINDYAVIDKIRALIPGIIEKDKELDDITMENKIIQYAYDYYNELESEYGAEGQKLDIDTIHKIAGTKSASKEVDDLTTQYMKNKKKLLAFMSNSQQKALYRMMYGEESNAGREIFNRLIKTIDSMPGQYETDKIKAADKIVHLHYFQGDSDWYIVEKDKGQSKKEEEEAGLVYGKQYQAFGYAILNGDTINAEWGYVNIQELIENNVELDFYWTPKKFSEIKKGEKSDEDIEIPITIGKGAGLLADAIVGELQQLPELDASYKIDKIEKTDPMYADGWRYEMTIGYPESLGENGNYDTGNFYKEVPSVETIIKDITDALTEHYQDLKEEGDIISGRDENIRNALAKVLDRENNGIETTIKPDIEEVVMPLEVVRLINFLDSINDPKKRAWMWNSGEDTPDGKDVWVASRSRVLPKIGRTLWQVALDTPGFTPVATHGEEKSLSWAGEELKTSIFTAYRKENMYAVFPEVTKTNKGKPLTHKEEVEIAGKAIKQTISRSLVQHDYKNPFELNKAIEALLDEKWSDPVEKWSAAELEFRSGYSGYGGLDEYGEISVGSLFEFYTPEKVIEKMWALAYKYGYKEGRMCEPSAGIGLFMKREYVKSMVQKDAYEINKYSAKICKLLYPEANVNDGLDVKYFEQLFIKNNYTVRDKIKPVHELVIGNPPYGEAQGLYMGMGEKSYTKAKNYIDYFIFRGLDLLVPGGLLIYIIGAEVAGGGTPWLDQGTSKCKELIQAKGKLIDAYRLPEGLFARTNVVTDIVVFRKR
jgi:hypothetical protein